MGKLLGLSFLCIVLPVGQVHAAGPDPAELKKTVERAVAFLQKNQDPDGSFSARFAGPGVSAVVVAGLLRNGYTVDDPVVAKTLKAIEKSVQEDGGIYDRRLANYTTAVSLMALIEANKDGRYDAIIANASKFLRGIQQNPTDAKSPAAGGFGYDASGRPDLSNTHFSVEALIASGLPKDDPAIKRALYFVSRCQNLPGETNDLPFAAKATEDDKGGFTYTPIDPDESRHKTPAGGLRSLGAMTYAGLKSFLYAGVNKEDPRVKGAVAWIRKHYTLDENIGLGKAGLFYYYHTFAKAMDALGEDSFEDARGDKHDWKKELYEAIKKYQRPDGSFINEGDRAFGEADPNLATGFALLALSYCK